MVVWVLDPDIGDDFYTAINLLFTLDKSEKIVENIFEKCNDRKRNWKDERFKFITNRDEFADSFITDGLLVNMII
jgi:hypothetical protein